MLRQNILDHWLVQSVALARKRCQIDFAVRVVHDLLIEGHWLSFVYQNVVASRYLYNWLLIGHNANHRDLHLGQKQALHRLLVQVFDLQGCKRYRVRNAMVRRTELLEAGVMVRRRRRSHQGAALQLGVQVKVTEPPAFLLHLY